MDYHIIGSYSLSQVLTEYIVQDLNINPKLPFEDNSFQVITNVVRLKVLPMFSKTFSS